MIMKKALIVFTLFIGALVVNARPDSGKLMSATTIAAVQQAVKTPVKPADLPKPIKDNIAKDYAGYLIKEADSVKLNDTMTYEVVLSKGTDSFTLVYDKDGNFLKKMGQ
jgi:hypothetical protein